MQFDVYFDLQGTATGQGSFLDLRGGFHISGTLSMTGTTTRVGVRNDVVGWLDGATISQGTVTTIKLPGGVGSGFLSVTGTNTVAAPALFVQADETDVVGSGEFEVSGEYQWLGGRQLGTGRVHTLVNGSFNIGLPGLQGQPVAPLAMVNGWTLVSFSAPLATVQPDFGAGGHSSG